MSFRRAFLASVCAASALGCGGASDSPLLGDAGTEPVVDSSSPDVSVTDTGGGKDVFTVDAPIKDVVTVDVPIGPGDSRILCGTSKTCSAQNEVCCHHTFSTPAYECVTDASQCQNAGDIPIGCSGQENCVSQGTPTYICCADLGGSNGTCSPATDVSCQATCDPTAAQDQVGCSGADPCQSTLTPVCKTSSCTLPGYPICTQ